MRLFACFAIVLLAVTSLAPAAADAPAAGGLNLLKVDLPDGGKWILGEGGVGRPFMATLLLDNPGKTPVTLWDHQNSEGAQCPGVVLTDPKGKQTVLQPPAIARAGGIPTVVTIQPHGVMRIELELLRLIGERGLPPGKYQLRGFYENKLKNDFGFIKAEVWTGWIESEAVTIEIVAPTRPNPAPGR